jgi:hypothetical protein
VEVLGAYRPDRPTTIDENRKLEAEWPTPQYASGEETDAAWMPIWTNGSGAPTSAHSESEA